MHKNSWLIYVYIIVGLVIISSLLYSFNFSVKDLVKPSVKQPVAGSETPATPPEEDSSIYTLELGKSTTIRGIVYTFSRISSDTRCDPALECAEPGKAELDLIVGGGGTSEIIQLNTQDPTTYANLTITVKKLVPVPISDKEKTVLTLEIKEDK